MTSDSYDNRLTGLWFSFFNRSSFLKSSITSNWDLKLRPVTRKKCKNANKCKKCKQIKQWCMAASNNILFYSPVFIKFETLWMSKRFIVFQI